MTTENQAITTQHNLSTSEGGRGYIADLFKQRLGTHSYDRYIKERLAADFACALATWFEDNHPMDAQEPVELLASRMVKAWAVAHGRPAPWATAVEIMGTITKQSDAEKAALLALDEQNHPDLVGYCREKNIARMRAGDLSGFMVEDEQHGEACIALFTHPARTKQQQADDQHVELAECETMAAMVAEREWAEHVGSGDVSSKVEAAFTQLHNDLHQANAKLAELHSLLEKLKDAHAFKAKCGGDADSAIDTGAMRDAYEWCRTAGDELYAALIANEAKDIQE